MLKQLLLAQLLCGLIWHAHAAAPPSIRSFTPQAEKYGLVPSRDLIGDMCRLIDDVFAMVPWPVHSNDLCNNLALNDPSQGSRLCPLFDIAKFLLSFLQSSYPMQCAPEGIPAPGNRHAKANTLLPTPLSRQLIGNRLPARFPHDTSKVLLDTEGPSYYWLYKNIMRLTAWAPCDALGWPSQWQAPEGWEVMSIVSAGADLSGYSIKATDMPFAAVLRRAASAETQADCKASLARQAQAFQTLGQRNSARRASVTRVQAEAQELCAGDQLVVLVRGTASAADWGYNLDMGMSSNAAYGAGRMHRGFQRLSDSIWDGGLRSVMDRLGASVSSVTIAGHSLGAAVASLLAARAQTHYAAASTQVTAVLIASPNVGDPTFASDFNSRVNTRNVDFFADMFPQVPCVGSMIDCGASAAGEGAGNITVKSLPYEKLGGHIRLSKVHMPLQQEAWDALATYTQDDFCDNRMSIGNHLEAVHMCAYACALSTGTDSEGDWCQLWDTQTDFSEGARLKQAGASYCMSGFNFISDRGDFPTFPMFPSVKDPEWLSKQNRRGPQNKQTHPQPAPGTQPAASPASEHEGHHHGL